MLSKLNGTRTVPMMSKIAFECKAEGYPAPTPQWYKYGIRLQNVPVNITVIKFGFVVLMKSSLILKAVTRDDAAEYICEVENIVGRTTQSVTLNVLCEFRLEFSLRIVLLDLSSHGLAVMHSTQTNMVLGLRPTAGHW